MSFTIVYDRFLGESLVEYGAILDSVSGSEDKYSQIFSNLVKYEDLASNTEEGSEEVITNLDEILKQVVDTLPVLNNVKSDREIESSYNLVIHILQLINKNDSNISEILKSNPSIIDDLIKIETNKSIELRPTQSSIRLVKDTTIISILTNFFNLLPVNEQIKVKLIQSILTILSNNYNNLSSLVSIFNKDLYTWLTNCNANDDEIFETYFQITNLLFLSQDKDDEAISNFKFLIKNLKFNITNKDQIIKLIVNALNTKKYYDLTFLDGSQIEFNDILTELLKIYNQIEINKFFSFVENNNSIEFIKNNQINIENLTFKLRLATICKLANVSPNSQISFESISETLKLKDELEVEYYLINAIRFGILQGRLSQEQKIFFIHKVNLLKPTLEAKDWELIKSKLQAWKESVSDLRSAVDQTHKNNKRKFFHRHNNNNNHYHNNNTHHNNNNNQIQQQQGQQQIQTSAEEQIPVESVPEQVSAN